MDRGSAAIYLFWAFLLAFVAEQTLTVGDMYSDDLVEFNEINDENSDYYFSDLAAQNLSHVTVNLVNSQIRMELQASQAYLSMFAFFSRVDVSYCGFSKFFLAASNEEREHGLMLIKYLNERGGKVHLKSLEAPPIPEKSWLSETTKQPSPLEAIKAAHRLERQVQASLLNLHESKEDPHLQDYLEANFINEQVESIKKLSDWITTLRRLKDSPLGLHQFDEELWNGSRG